MATSKKNKSVVDIKVKKNNIDIRKPSESVNTNNLEQNIYNINQNNILDIKTVQTSNIKLLFETLKEVLYGDIRLIFTPKHIKILEAEGTGKVIVNLNLNSEAFEQYYCKYDEINVGINTTNMHKIIKTSSNIDVLSFSISKDREDLFVVRTENSEDNKINEFTLVILNYENVENLHVPNIEFSSVISLPSNKFQKYMKDLNSLGVDCLLDIICVGQKLVFKCRGDFSENKISIGKNSKNEFIEGEDHIVQGTFMLKFLILFTKATNLSSIVHIHLKNDFPIIIEYAVGALGSLRFILDPE